MQYKLHVHHLGWLRFSSMRIDQCARGVHIYIDCWWCNDLFRNSPRRITISLRTATNLSREGHILIQLAHPNVPQVVPHDSPRWTAPTPSPQCPRCWGQSLPMSIASRTLWIDNQPHAIPRSTTPRSRNRRQRTNCAPTLRRPRCDAGYGSDRLAPPSLRVPGSAPVRAPRRGAIRRGVACHPPARGRDA